MKTTLSPSLHKLRATTITLFLTVVAWTAIGAQYVIQPGPAESKDIFTTSVYSFTPGGGGPGGGLNDYRLRVGGWADLYYSLLQFDLTGLPPNASSAVLYLYCFYDSGSATPMYLDRITQAWDWRTSGTGRDRERLWWADRPAATQWIPNTIPAALPEQWYAVDITGLYNAWKSGLYPNYGLQLRPQQNGNNYNAFYSADYADNPALRPKLVITAPAPVAPGINAPPQSQAVHAGVNVTFGVTATGTPPLSYQWRKNGVNIAGETSSTLALGFVGSWSAGIYSVVVSNPYDSKTSAGAQLTVSSPLILVETSLALTVAMSTPAILCPTSPSQLKTFVDGSFRSGVTLASGKRTIVLTHGWIPAVGQVGLTGGIDGWPKEMAKTLVSQQIEANIVAWDWGCAASSFLCNPGKAAAETQIQGPALGQALSAALGANYSREIHFIGSSLGTLANARAADHLHSQGFAWSKTHMTLFDEAEIATDTDCGRFFAYALYRSPSDAEDYRQPLPAKFFWADNYVSLIGRLQRKAANVILTKGLPSSASTLWSFKEAAVAFHGYPISWYEGTIATPSESLMGFHWSFEKGGFAGAPEAGTVYVQAFTTSGLDLVQLNTYDKGKDLLDQRFQDYHTTVKPFLAPAIAHGQIVGAVFGEVIYTLAEQVNMRIDLWTSAAAVGPLAPNRSPHSLDRETAGASAVTNVPAYAWIPITIPSNAVSMSFDFLLQGDGQNDSFAAALNGTNVLSVAANLIQTNVTLNSGSIDVSLYSGQQVELFLGIVGGTSTNAAITVTNLRFLGFTPPSLQAQLSGNNLVVIWPISEDGYAFETSTSLTGTNLWSPVTNVPAIVDFQNTVTNPVSAVSRFYRLRKQ